MSAQVNLSYRPQGPILEAYIAGTERREFIMGPLGSGKTNGSCWKAFRIMCRQAPNAEGVRKTRGYAVRNTYSDLLSTTIKDWLDMFGDKAFGRFVNGSSSPPTHHIRFALEDGTVVESELVFLALDRPDDVKKLRGSQMTFCWLNETKELNKSIFDMADLRVGRYPSAADGGPSWFGVFGDTNAPDEDHWYYKLAEEVRPEGFVFHRQPGGVIQVGIGENTMWIENENAENIQNLPKGYYKNGVSGKSEDWIKVNLANEYGFVQDGKPVYPEYRDSVHCKEFDFVPEAGLYIGLDFGLTPAAIFGQKLVMGQWRWHNELVTEDTGVVQFANMLKDFIHLNYRGVKILAITGDPAGEQRQGGDTQEKIRTVFQILAANGIDSRPAHTNNFTKRRESVAAALNRMIDGQAGFLIHPQCKITRKGMAGAYHYKRVQVAGDAKYKDEPDKNSYSHSCFVAGTKISVPTGYLNIESLAVGDIVRTPIGDRLVVFTGNRLSEVMDIYFSDGRKTTCTPDHPFYTQDGFVRADALQYSHIIASESISWKYLFRLHRFVVGLSGQYSLYAEKDIIFEQGIINLRSAITCIGMFGGRTSVKSLLGGMFTTRITTELITIRQILNAYRQKCMDICTWMTRTGNSRLVKISSPQYPQQLNGAYPILSALVKLVNLGQEVLLRSSPYKGKILSPALIAEESTKDICISSRKGSAGLHVKQRPESSQVSTTRIVFALFVSKTFELIATRLKKPVRVIALGERYQGRVYNVEVQEAHSYYANNALVSNCEAGQYLMMGAGEGRAIIVKPRDTPLATVAISDYSIF